MNSNLSFEIKIIFDNRCVEEGFLTGFGFSALIYNYFTENYILFDTGGDSRVLIHNINNFNIDVTQIKKVIISHSHFDHAGGLEGIYKLNPNIEIFVPESNKQWFSRKIRNAKVHGVSELIEIEKNAYSSGELGGSSLKEQGLFLKTKDDEFIIIVGCAHPGLENFIIKARKMNDIKAIIGGFHGFRKYSYLEGIEVIGACHCTQHINEIMKRFPGQFKKVCVGNTLIF